MTRTRELDVIRLAGRMGSKWRPRVHQSWPFSTWQTGWKAPRPGSVFDGMYEGYPETLVNEGIPLGLGYDGRAQNVFLLDVPGNNWHGTSSLRRATSHEGGDFTYLTEWAKTHDMPVRSMGAGTAHVALFFGTGGRSISVDHGDGLISYYGHVRETIVSDGQHVERGQPIAHADGGGAQHLHVGIEFRGAWLNLFDFLDPAMTGEDAEIIDEHYTRGDVGGNYAETPWARAHQNLPPDHIPVDAVVLPPDEEAEDDPDPVDPDPVDPGIRLARAGFAHLESEARTFGRALDERELAGS